MTPTSDLGQDFYELLIFLGKGFIWLCVLAGIAAMSVGMDHIMGYVFPDEPGPDDGAEGEADRSLTEDSEKAEPTKVKKKKRNRSPR